MREDGHGPGVLRGGSTSILIWSITEANGRDPRPILGCHDFTPYVIGTCVNYLPNSRRDNCGGSIGKSKHR